MWEGKVSDPQVRSDGETWHVTVDGVRKALDYHGAIQKLPHALNELITNASEATGWVFVVLAAGPNPLANGDIHSLEQYFGPKSTTGHTFQEAHAKYKEAVERPFLEHVKGVFPSHIRKLRALSSSELKVVNAQSRRDKKKPKSTLFVSTDDESVPSVSDLDDLLPMPAPRSTASPSPGPDIYGAMSSSSPFSPRKQARERFERDRASRMPAMDFEDDEDGDDEYCGPRSKMPNPRTPNLDHAADRIDELVREMDILIAEEDAAAAKKIVSSSLHDQLPALPAPSTPVHSRQPPQLSPSLQPTVPPPDLLWNWRSPSSGLSFPTVPATTPTVAPTTTPTIAPTTTPTVAPTTTPTVALTTTPTVAPTTTPTVAPTTTPTVAPTTTPTVAPTTTPTVASTITPAVAPAAAPVVAPTAAPIVALTAAPAASAFAPAIAPTAIPPAALATVPTAPSVTRPTATSPAAAPAVVPTAITAIAPTITPIAALDYLVADTANLALAVHPQPNGGTTKAQSRSQEAAKKRAETLARKREATSKAAATRADTLAKKKAAAGTGTLVASPKKVPASSVVIGSKRKVVTDDDNIDAPLAERRVR
ncbi:hypothetical protein Hypma_011228 [Hypsizygus marmoreus]|uniref:Uncharacterized protein n=1 Tax=Hypsizygus marmoreus TaxID=39966 RepID=A0A369JHP6_HYPMA|nr:hypothetical protein Hypma_011228 [Hypsizygus marmoreus]